MDSFFLSEIRGCSLNVRTQVQKNLLADKVKTYTYRTTGSCSSFQSHSSRVYYFNFSISTDLFHVFFPCT